MNFKTIGIGGQLCSGKDCLADYLVGKLHKWRRNAFANAVKKVFEETFNVDREFTEEWKRKSEVPPGFDLPVRDSLIKIGDGFRKIKENIWIELAFRDQKENQIISDMRYFNEAKYIKSKNGFTVLIWRPGYENDIDNPSESEVVPFIQICKNLNTEGIIDKTSIRREFPFDFFFINDGSLEKMYKKVDGLLLPEINEFFK